MELTDNMRALVSNLSELIGQHFRLAKVELKEDLREYGVNAGKIVAFAPLLLIGYIFLCVAAALFLRRYLAADLAFLAVAGFNFVLGGLGIFLSVQRIKGRVLLGETFKQLETTAVVLRGERG